MEFRSIDGTGNNLAVPGTNALNAAFDRIGAARYADGISSMVSAPNARSISNLVVGEGDQASPNTQGLSGMLYAWGQFIDHDITRTPSDGVTRIDIVVPNGDPVFANGTTLLMTRAITAPGTGAGTGVTATAINRSTGWLDASVVYGSDAVTAAGLRNADGTMKTSAGDNLPTDAGRFLAGDPRVSENPSLTSLQTLFLREHNWQVARLQAADPGLTGDQLYDMARAIVGAEIQRITYGEFLPHLLGDTALPTYAGYRAGVDATLSLEFAAAAYRWGHSTVSAETFRRDEFGAVIGSELELRDVFFMAPQDFVVDGGAGAFLRHLGADRAQAMDARIVEALRSFLQNPGVGQDLASLNIQRGRDLGLPTLNDTRAALGLSRHASFASITDDAGTIAGLTAAYGNVNLVDLWVGGIAERLVPGAFLGETFRTIVADQFLALRDGDRLWYQAAGFDAATLALIEGTRLSDIILRNTDTQHYQPDAFLATERRAAGGLPENPGLPQLVLGYGVGDVLAGGALGDMLVGADGRQIQHGFGGADTLHGAGGDDALDGGAGNDEIWGEDGADEIWAGQGDDVARGGAGRDTMRGDVGQDVLAGGADDDVIAGEAGDDTLYGEDGADLLFGGQGLDVLYGYAGNDTLYGDENNDQLNGADGDDVLNGGTGRDALWGMDGADAIWGADGADTAFGGAGNDTLYGGAQADTLFGEAGDDNLAAGDDDDLLVGGAGNDALFGEGAKDTIEGGAGSDWMLGGGGPDQFIFGPDAADGMLDWIADFARSDADRIDLSAFPGVFTVVPVHNGPMQVVLTAGGSTVMVRVWLGLNDAPDLLIGVTTPNPLGGVDFVL